MGIRLYNYGCKPTKFDKRDYQIKALSSQIEQLPQSFQLQLFGDIKDQQQVFSCVAHAASSVLEYYDQGKNKLSTNFIYGIKKQLFNDNGPGMYLNDACKIITKYGDPLEKDCSGNDEIPECYQKANKAFNDTEIMNYAKNFKIYSYFKCNTINDIKLAIYKYGPVLLSIKWFINTLVDDQSGELIFNSNNNFGYHCVMCYGWDEKGLLCKNSYGISWGKNGLFILPYTYPEINDARALIDSINPNEDHEELFITSTNGFFKTLFYKIYNLICNLIYNK